MKYPGSTIRNVYSISSGNFGPLKPRDVKWKHGEYLPRKCHGILYSWMNYITRENPL
jgi:hypothetical protein